MDLTVFIQFTAIPWGFSAAVCVPECYCRTPKSDHISPVLHTLHWLPVEQRIEYKLFLLAFRSLNDCHMSDLLKLCIPS